MLQRVAFYIKYYYNYTVLGKKLTNNSVPDGSGQRS